MQVTLNLPDEIAAQAQAAGKTPESYLQEFLESSLLLRSADRKVMTAQELEDFFEKMSRQSSQIPYLPDEAFTRESIYSDHD